MGTKELKQQFDTSVARLQDLVPVGIDPKSIINAFNLTVTNPKFAGVNPIVLIQKFELAAQLGLKVNGPEGHCYMIPIKDTVEMFIGYKGYVEMACRSGHIQSVRAFAVYENDFFEADFGTDPKLIHRPNVKDPGPVKCYYAIAYHRDGWRDFLIMSPDRITKIRDKSSGYKSAKSRGIDHPWISSYDEMAMKTVTSRLLRTIRLPGDMIPFEDEPGFDQEPVTINQEPGQSEPPKQDAPKSNPKKSAILEARDKMKATNQPPIEIPATVIDSSSAGPEPVAEPADSPDPISVLPDNGQAVMDVVERFWNDASELGTDEHKAAVEEFGPEQTAHKKAWYNLIMSTDPDTDKSIASRVATLATKAGIALPA
jgi:recombination protein RecT